MNFIKSGTSALAGRWIHRVVTLCILLALYAGGGDSPKEARASQAKQAALSAVPLSDVVVTGLTKVSETRVSRTVFDYVFKVTIKNNGSEALIGVTATLTGVGSGATTVDGAVQVGNLAAGATLVPIDTITIRQDRTYPFDQSKLIWQLTANSNQNVNVPPFPRPPDPSKIVVDTETGEKIIADEVLACFTDTTDVTKAIEIGQLFQGNVIGSIPRLGNCYQFQLPPNSTPSNVKAAITILNARPEVTVATPHSVGSLAFVPCSTSGILPTCFEPSYSLLHLGDAHDRTLGGGVTVAVIDSGVDSANQDLNPIGLDRIIMGQNYTQPRPRQQATDQIGHGTHVAGIIAATAPESKIYAAKVCFSNGDCPELSIAEAILDAADILDIKVINLSLQSYVPTPFITRAVGIALGAGKVVVAAAGNRNQSSPSNSIANISGVLSVGNVSNTDIRYSNAVGGSNFGSWVKIAAPGVDIASNAIGGGTKFDTGTSMSAPFVAGTAALLRSFNPSWTNSQVVTQLTQSAIAIGPNNQDLGSGRLDPVAALGAIRITRTGLTPQSSITSTLVSLPSTIIFNRPDELGPSGLGCTARTLLPCYLDIGLDSKTLAAGSYTLRVRVDSPTTFGYSVKLTVPGMTFQSVAFGSATISPDKTEASGMLFGLNGNLNAVIFNITKQ
jgi:subtilisin family serine protease